MSLKDLLLEGKLPDPFAQKFDKKAWDAAYKVSERAEDKNLYRCLEVILPYKNALLEALFKTAYGKERKRVLVERLLMYNAMNALELQQAFRREARKHSTWTVSRAPKIKFGKTNDMGADDLNTILIDALKLPIEFLLSAARQEESVEKPPLEITDSDIPKIISLASAWKTLRDLWASCVFAGAHAEETAGKITFSGQNRGYFAVGKARYMQLNMTRHIEAVHAEQRARNHIKNTDVGSYRRDGEDVDYRVPENPFLEVDHFAVGDFMRQEILPAPTTRNPEITHYHVMKGFDVLGDIANEALTRLSHPKKFKSNEYILDQQCRFSRASLSSAIRDRLEVNQEMAESVLDTLSYDGSGLFDPWATPVISLDNNACCLLPGVLCFANRAFALESILRNENYNMESRGPAFERHVHDEISKAIEQCQYRGITKLSEPSIVVTNDNKSEEVDLLLCLGKEVYVFEVKCVLFPVEPRSEHFFCEKMREADAQLDRKLSFITHSWAKIQATTPALKSFPADPTSIRGAVITNFHGGPLEGLRHPICEPSALVHYFVAGKSILGATVSAKKSDVDPAIIASYYNSFSSFRKNFYAYLETAPHVLPFSAFLHFRPILADFRDIGIDMKCIEIDSAELLYPQENRALFEMLKSVADKVRSTFKVQ